MKVNFYVLAHLTWRFWMQMAYYHYNQFGPEALQAAAFDWLNQGFYLEAIDGFQRVIWKLAKKSRSDETLQNLGKLRRGLAQALYCVKEFQDASKQIQLCISGGYHEHSEVSV